MTSQGPPKIVIVDDEDAILETMMFTFMDLYEVITANNAQRALELIEEQGPISVVITDQRMPGMTGVELLEEVYAKYDATSIDVPELKDPSGQTAKISIVCYMSEMQMPPEFGPVEDIDGDPATSSGNVSADYKLLPVRLTLTYGTANGPQTQEVFLILGEN